MTLGVAGSGGLTYGGGWNFDAPGTYVDVGGTGSTLTITDRSAVPEPASSGLLLVAAVGLVARKRRLRQNLVS